MRGLDEIQEKERGKDEIGTTRRGIGPVFSDKVARFGLRAGDILEKGFEQKVFEIWSQRKKLFFKAFDFSDLLIREYLEYAKKLVPYIVETDFS